MDDENPILCRLARAIDTKDADGVEEALGDVFEAGLTPDLVPQLVVLLESPWHFRHEDVARAPQELKPPDAVPALRRAAVATHEYLDYDEFFGLARKCTWALADIGTAEAKAALRELSESGNETIAAYARKRLHNWEEELQRKGG